MMTMMDGGSHPAKDRYHLLCSRCGWRLSVKNIIGEDFPHLNRKTGIVFRRFVFFGCISHWEDSRGWIRHTPNFYNFGSLIEILECFIDTSYTETYTIYSNEISIYTWYCTVFLITETQNMYTDLNTDRFTLLNMYIYIYMCVCVCKHA